MTYFLFCLNSFRSMPPVMYANGFGVPLPWFFSMVFNTASGILSENCPWVTGLPSPGVLCSLLIGCYK